MSFFLFSFIYFSMGMLSEIEKFLNTTSSSMNYRILNVGGTGLYVEGIKSVVSFGEEEMRFQLGRGLLVVSGVNLSVKYLDKSTCVLSGKIISVVVQ